MQKGKYGICYWFYAALAFILAFLGQILLSGLLLGFVIVAEKDEWLTKQVMQAFFLSICSSLIHGILSIFDFVNQVPILSTIFSVVFGIIEGLISLLVLVCVIIGIIRSIKGQNANIPGFSTLADRAFGIIAQKVYTNVPSQTPYNNGVNYAPPASAPNNSNVQDTRTPVSNPESHE